MDSHDERWHAVLAEVIDRTHLASGDDLPAVVNGAAGKVGISVELYLVDLRQEWLSPLRAAVGEPQGVDSTLAGRAFRFVEIEVSALVPDGLPVLWMPLLDGTERLGVARMVLPPDADPHDTELRSRCWSLAGLVGHLVMTKFAYSDTFHSARRAKPLSVASELLWQLLPPQTFACPELVVTAVVEPYDRVGGDGYDYAVQDRVANLAVFDAVGHDIQAGLTCALALGATRNARRNGSGLAGMAQLADTTVQAHSTRFVTALLVEFELDTGVLRFINAGHPPPVLLRSGHVVKRLTGALRTPLGLGHLRPGPVHIGREQLEPGDRVLLHTDGVTEARDPNGAVFGLDRLIDLTERNASAGLPPPETLRRLSHAVLEHQRGVLQDDATLLLMEWTASTSPLVLPSR